METFLFLPDAELRLLRQMEAGIERIQVERQPPGLPFAVVFEFDRAPAIRATAKGKTFSPKFECFRISLAIQPCQEQWLAERLPGVSRSTAQILVHRELLLPAPEISDVTVGQNPMIQVWQHPAAPVPDGSSSALVAAGFTLEDGDSVLLIHVDEFSGALKIERDRDVVKDLTQEAVSICLDEAFELSENPARAWSAISRESRLH